jgi:hypothetical protein
MHSLDIQMVDVLWFQYIKEKQLEVVLCKKILKDVKISKSEFYKLIYKNNVFSIKSFILIFYCYKMSLLNNFVS